MMEFWHFYVSSFWVWAGISWGTAIVLRFILAVFAVLIGGIFKVPVKLE